MMSQVKQIVIKRSFAAPRELVIRCWIEPEHLLHWFRASPDWTTPHAKTDPRGGGIFNIGFGSPDGKNDFDFTGHYEIIEPPSRLVLKIGDGRAVTILFSENNGKTDLTLTLDLEPIHSEEQQREGWSAMLGNLDLHLERNAP
jgi:uncharacterized protein YndB with AHSA1/START domain